MEIKKSLLCLSFIAGLTPLAAMADQPSYSYVEAGYLELDLDDIGIDMSGIFVGGSVEIGNNWFAVAGYDWADKQWGTVDLDVEEFSIGAGFRTAITDNAGVYLSASYITAEAEITSSFGSDETISDDGYGLEAGIRALVSTSIELNGSVGYADSGDEDATTYRVGAIWYLKEDFGVLAEIGSDNDSNREYRFGARIFF